MSQVTEEVKKFKGCVGPPLAVSALRHRGLNPLRAEVEKLQLSKEFVIGRLRLQASREQSSAHNHFLTSLAFFLSCEVKLCGDLCLGHREEITILRLFLIYAACPGRCRPCKYWAVWLSLLKALCCRYVSRNEKR